MLVNLLNYDEMEHGEYHADYAVDWTHPFYGKRYKKHKYSTYWRVYENGLIRFNSSGANNPDTRAEVTEVTNGTAELVLCSKLPTLYTADGRKVVKTHTFAEHSVVRGHRIHRRREVYPADTCLIDHQFGLAQITGMGESRGFYLPSRHAQPIVGPDTWFRTYWVSRTVRREYEQRRQWVQDNATAMEALAESPQVAHQIRTESQKRKDEIRALFAKGDFSDWTTSMYLWAAREMDKGNEYLYSLCPSETVQRLYLTPNRGAR
jgi:hypothetical protein